MVGTMMETMIKSHDGNHDECQGLGQKPRQYISLVLAREPHV